MPLVTIVNPSPRKGATKMATRKKPRTAKQKAATRKMIAANRARARGHTAAPKRRKARAATATHHTPAKRRTTRRRAGGWKITPPKVASRAGRALRYRRPNPIGFLTNTLIPSAVGGVGAVAIDVAIGALPLPEQMKTGPFAPLVKVGGAVAMGMLAGKMVSRRVGEQIAAGAITVQVYNLTKMLLMKVGQGRIPGLSMYPDGYMGEYVSGDEIPELGYTDSGINVGAYEDQGVSGYESGVYR